MTYKPKFLTPAEGGLGASTTATSGKVLRGDGTNWIASTPTFPTTAGTTGTVLRSDGTNIVNSTAFTIGSTGIMGNTAQPVLFAKIGTTVTNVTGDGTLYTILFDTVVSQQGSNYNSGTGTYTIPVTGYYLVVCNVVYAGVISSHTTGVIKSGGTHNFITQFGPFQSADASGNVTGTVNFIRSFTASDTLTITTTISGGTKVVDLVGEDFGVHSLLNIALIC